MTDSFTRLPYVTKESNPAETYSREELLEVIKETKIIGAIKEQVILRADKSGNAKAKGLLAKNSPVEIIRDSGETWYFVKDLASGREGWVRAEFLSIPDDSIPDDENADTSDLNSTQLEGFANLMGYESPTPYLVIVDINRQKTHIFEGSKNKWALLRTLDCSTGKNSSPTIRGEYSLENRGQWFYSERLGSGGKFWVRFSGDYLFHSVAMDKNKNIVDDTIGRKSSNGCVRLSLEDAEWFYLNVPDGTKVNIL